MAPGGIRSGGTVAGHHEFVAGGEQRHAGRARDPQLVAADRWRPGRKRPGRAGGPACSTTAPRCTSSPLRRIHWPGSRHAQDAHHLLARGLRVFLHHDRRRRPRGTGAPVKMRAAVPGCSGAPALPGGDALADRQHHAFVGDLGAAHRIAVHGTVVLRRHLQRRHQVLAPARGRRRRRSRPRPCRQRARTAQQVGQGVVQGSQRPVLRRANGRA